MPEDFDANGVTFVLDLTDSRTSWNVCVITSVRSRPGIASERQNGASGFSTGRDAVARRRGHGEGSIYRRSDGRWVAAVSHGGRRKYLYGRTRQEAARKLTAALKARDDGLPFVGERLTVGQFLGEWLEITRSMVRPKTWDRYEQYVRLHAVPEVGRIRLSRLAPQDLQRLYARRLAAGSSPTTVAHPHAMLHRAFGQAVRWGLVQRNVVALVDPPRVRRAEMRVLSVEEARRLLHAATDDRLEALYVLALATGMRLGELLALRWRDVQLQDGTLRLSGSMQRTSAGLQRAEPKTTRSRRQIVLSATAVEALRRHAGRQEQERARLGPAWEETGLVFANRVGRPLEAQNVLQRSLRPLLRRAGLPSIRFHDLRHTAATLLLGRGVHPKIVADLLGHSTTAITNDVYSHVTPRMHQAAVDALEDVLRP